MGKALAWIIIIAAMIAVSIVFVGLIVKIVCWAFELTFTWKMVVGIWVVLLTLGIVCGSEEK
jgi:hypothetical protein